MPVPHRRRGERVNQQSKPRDDRRPAPARRPIILKPHDERVASIQEQIRAWNDAGRPGKLCTSRPGWQTVSSRHMEYKKDNWTVDLDLHDILEIDEERRVIRVEPRVNMGQLTEALAPRGWTIPLVAELDDLTVGGLLLGYGMETSAHKYGLFSDTVLSAELVLADGRVVTCSDGEHPELFHALPWSYGSLGFLTAVELPLIPAKPFVRLTYEPFRTRDEGMRRFEELTLADDPPEFVEQLYFEPEEGVLMYGDFADLPPGKRPNAIGDWRKPWFYKHAETAMSRGRFVDYVPLRDYYHRHTRSLYWHGELLVPFGNHPAFRHTLGWLMPPKVSFMKLTQTERIRKYRDERNVVQDGLLPLRFQQAGIEMFHDEFETYPLWLCPHRTYETHPGAMFQPKRAGDEALVSEVSGKKLAGTGGYLAHHQDKKWEMFVDIGAWQVPRFVRRGEAWDGRVAVKHMEKWLREHEGVQCMYAVTEQTREEFWEMFDATLYEEMRDRWGAKGVFMDVFDKVKRPEI